MQSGTMGMISGDERLGKQQASLTVGYFLLQLPSAVFQDFGTSLEDLLTSQVRRLLTLLILIKLYRKCSRFLTALNIFFFFKLREFTVRSFVLLYRFKCSTLVFMVSCWVKSMKHSIVGGSRNRNKHGHPQHRHLIPHTCGFLGKEGDWQKT